MGFAAGAFFCWMRKKQRKIAPWRIDVMSDHWAIKHNNHKHRKGLPRSLIFGRKEVSNLLVCLDEFHCQVG